MSIISIAQEDRKDVIEKLIKHPELLRSNELNAALLKPESIPPIEHEEIRKIFLRIFDLNDKPIHGYAKDGLLGKLNRRSQKKRNKKFNNRIRKGGISKKIVVEGDSWFEHPLIKDTFDWLCDLRKDYALYSLAHGGDWLLNIIKDGKYISDLATIKPDVLMLSGGGNDLVDDHRLAIMVDKDQSYFDTIKESGHKYANIDSLVKQPQIMNIEQAGRAEEKLKIGLPYLSRDFWSTLWGFELIYKYIIQQVRRKYPNLRIMIVGYDYAIPSFSQGPGILQWVMNKAQRNGHWLKESMILSGVEDSETQEAIIFSLIFLFNQMISDISQSKEFGREVFHLDGRYIAESKKDWYDELHLKRRGFKKLAERAIKLIDSPLAPPSSF